MTDPGRQRRTVLKWLSAGLMAAVGAVLAVPALRVISFPLRRRTVRGGDDPIAVGDLARLPEGVPVRATVTAASRVDAWSRASASPLGAVWLLRRGAKVTAYATTCPHAGCFVDFDEARRRFQCPCHESAFDLDGRRVAGPAPRAMDTLETELRGTTVLVRFQRFRQATADKEPIG